MLTLLRKIWMKHPEKMQEEEKRRRMGSICSGLGIGLNILLFAGKFLAGILSGSIAIQADAFNNLSDAGSSAISLAGFSLAGKKPDPEHPFGHGRIEYISGLAISAMILLMGLELGKTSLGKMIHPAHVRAGFLTIMILLVSILVKGYMAFYNRQVGKELNSTAMLATAADSLSDALATSMVLLAIVIEKTTHLQVDGWCGMLVSCFVLYAGYGAARDTLRPLLGQAPEPEFVKRIEDIVMSYPMVIGIHDLVVHDYGPGRVMISLHAEVPGTENLYELHDMIDNAENELHETLNCEAVIHMDPVAVDNPKVEEYKKKVLEVTATMKEILSLHDFRMVTGPTHTNLIFDIVVPADYSGDERTLVANLQEEITKRLPNCYVVVKVDHSYV